MAHADIMVLLTAGFSILRYADRSSRSTELQNIQMQTSDREKTQSSHRKSALTSLKVDLSQKIRQDGKVPMILSNSSAFISM